MRWAILIALTFVACGDDSQSATPDAAVDAPAPIDVPADRPIDAPTSDALAVGTRTDLDFDPNGVLWDSGSSTLFITDESANRLMKWTMAGGVQLVADFGPLPAMTGGTGQVVRAAGGGGSGGPIFVPRFGFGTNGGIWRVANNNSFTALMGLDVTRRRIGHAIAPDATMYESYFTVAAGARTGEVASFTVSGSGGGPFTATETPLAVPNLKKVVGLVATTTDLYVSDQDNGLIVRVPRATPTAPSNFAAVSQPDLICAGPSGTLFSSSRTGGVFWISTTGDVTQFAQVDGQSRGCAYDDASRTLYVAEHSTQSLDGGASAPGAFVGYAVP